MSGHCPAILTQCAGSLPARAPARGDNRGIIMSSIRGSLILIALGLIASAPVAQAGGILGARLGTSISNVSGGVSNTIDMANQNGFTATAFLQMGDGLISLQPELGYVEKGVTEKTTASDLQFNYAEIAGLAKVNIPVLPVQTHVFGGVGADVNVKNVVPAGTSVDVNKLDWNAIFGGDVMLKMAGLAVVGDGRYAMGLSDVTSASSAVGDIKNRAWMFSAGVGIKF
jgi:hypothetical protein